MDQFFVESGIEPRVPYRKTFSISGARADMEYWNQYCDVNWSAHKFTAIRRDHVDPKSLFIKNFFVDIDVWQMGSKVNGYSAPKLEDHLRKFDIRRLWVLTPHGFNAYIRAPFGCDAGHLNAFYLYLTEVVGVDVDVHITDPLAQRKAINSYCYESNNFIIPLRTDEVRSDVDYLNFASAKNPRMDVESYWEGSNALLLDKNKHVRNTYVKDATLLREDLGLCPVMAHISTKEKIGFHERLDLLKYVRAVNSVPKRLLEKTICDLVGSAKWYQMSGQERLFMLANSGRAFFDPKRLKLMGYCPSDCYRCQDMIEEKNAMKYWLSLRSRVK